MKIFNFKRRNKEESEERSFASTAVSASTLSPVFHNDAVALVDTCCRCCTNAKPPVSYNAMVEYILGRIKLHHESILEHSNIVMKIEADALTADNYFAIIDNLQYIRVVKDQKYIYLAASIRGWKEFFRHSDMDHPTIMQLFTEFSVICPRCTVADLINEGYVDEYAFPEEVIDGSYEDDITADDWNNNESGSNIYTYLNPIPSADPTAEKNVDIINCDDLDIKLLNFDWMVADEQGPETGRYISEINPFDFLKLGTITVCFTNMSRAATHQIVRHRNGITQESMRYVNYSNASFYIPSKAEGVKLSNGQTLDEFYKSCANLYVKAVDSKSLTKEDARNILPIGVECGKLYMTFTWYSLAKFLQLRMDKAAQEEIRNYAILLYESIKDVMDEKLAPWGITFKSVINSIDSWCTDPYSVEYTDCEESCDETISDDEIEDAGNIEEE